MDECVIRFDDYMKNRADAASTWIKLWQHIGTRSSDTPLTIQFSTGRYDFNSHQAVEREYYISNHTQTGIKKCGILLENRGRITLEGNGAEIICHGEMIPLAVVGAPFCVLKNFTIDYENPPVKQVRIRSVDSTTKAIVVEFLPQDNYRIEKDRELFLVGDDNIEYKVTSVIHFEVNGRMVYNQPDHTFSPESIEEIAPGVLRFCGWRGDLVAGIYLALRVSPRPTPGVFLHQADNIRIENVTVHFAFGMGLLAQRTENISLNGFRVCRRGEGDYRRFTTHADATHFSCCKGVIRSENGLYEGMNDDAINVHGIYLKVIKHCGKRTLRAAYPHQDCWGFEWGQPGDAVQFIRRRTMEYSEDIRHIVSISPVDAASYVGAKVFDIEFDDIIPEAICGNTEYGIENLSWVPEVIFRGNTVRNNRARGALFSTSSRVLCEKNVFDHVHGSAILLCGDCNGWYESGPCRNVHIRNNKFINALTANYQFTRAVISICPEIPDLAAQYQFYHSNIEISHNEFSVFDKPVLYVKSAIKIKFTDNTICYNHEFPAFHENQRTFLLEHVDKPLIRGNNFTTHPEFERDIELRNSLPEYISGRNSL